MKYQTLPRRLAYFQKNWKELTQDPTILDVTGYKIISSQTCTEKGAKKLCPEVRGCETIKHRNSGNA